MRTAALIIFAAALSAASANQLGMDDLWTKAGAYKIMEYCIGENVTHEYVKHAEEVLDKCYNASSLDNFELTIASMEISNWDKLFHDFAVNTTGGNVSTTDQYAPLVETFTCVYQGLHLMDANNSINITGVKNGYEKMNLSQALETELLAGVDQCYEIAQCLPESQTDDSNIPSELLELKIFLSCELYLRNWACLKTYLRTTFSCKIDFSGGDRILGSDSDDEIPTTSNPNTDQI